MVDQALAVIDGAAPAMRTSMQRDVAAGRPSEIEVPGRRRDAQGARCGWPPPRPDLVYAALLPRELKAQPSAH